MFKKYDEYKENMYKPQAELEAKMFGLETRMKEEESERSSEYIFLKDTMKRLVYTLENYEIKQASFNNKE